METSTGRDGTHLHAAVDRHLPPASSFLRPRRGSPVLTARRVWSRPRHKTWFSPSRPVPYYTTITSLHPDCFFSGRLLQLSPGPPRREVSRGTAFGDCGYTRDFLQAGSPSRHPANRESTGPVPLWK